MGTNIKWFQEAFNNILQDIDVINNLSDIKISLSALNSNEVKYTASCLNLSPIFDSLNSSARNQIELACEVLKITLSALDSLHILNQYEESMVRALKHPNIMVKELVLSELNRAAWESDLTSRLSRELDLILSVVECVGHEESSVARLSIHFLTGLGITSVGLEAIYAPNVLQALKEVSLTSDINRFRVYEIAIEVSANSLLGLESSHSSGILEMLLLELKNDDVLALLTTLEFVTKLALTQHGFNYLESQGVVTHLANQIFNPLIPLVMPGLIKFFGNVAQLRPQETFRDYPRVTESIFCSVNDSDQCLVCVALETIGYIATTPVGKRALLKKDDMKNVMKRIFEIITKWPSEYRIRGLNVLANIVTLELSEQDTEMLVTVQSWFDYMGSPAQTMNKLMEMAQQPFLEIKLAVFLLLRILAGQPWSQLYINNTPGLVELLMDRSSDSTMKEKAARFAVIGVLSESATSEAIFGEETVKLFNKFIKEGAVYVQQQTEVAIEKAD